MIACYINPAITESHFLVAALPCSSLCGKTTSQLRQILSSHCPVLGHFRHFKQKATPELLVEVFEIISGINLSGLGSMDVLWGPEGELLALDATPPAMVDDGKGMVVTGLS